MKTNPKNLDQYWELRDAARFVTSCLPGMWRVSGHKVSPNGEPFYCPRIVSVGVEIPHLNHSGVLRPSNVVVGKANQISRTFKPNDVQSLLQDIKSLHPDWFDRDWDDIVEPGLRLFKSYIKENDWTVGSLPEEASKRDLDNNPISEYRSSSSEQETGLWKTVSNWLTP